MGIFVFIFFGGFLSSQSFYEWFTKSSENIVSLLQEWGLGSHRTKYFVRPECQGLIMIIEISIKVSMMTMMMMRGW